VITGSDMGEGMRAARFEARPVDLLRQAAGGPAEMVAKARRLGSILAAFARGDELDARLGRLHEKGIVEVIPSRVQLFVGGADMLRFWITPAAADYYEKMGISFTFHQILRFLDEPSSLVDPVGFFSARDGIIGHLMQVVHANPVYDLELLQMFDDGLDELEAQLEGMLAGTHPRTESIRAIVEEPEYHGRLLDFVRVFRRDPTAPPMLRSNIEEGGFGPLERTFGSLRTSMRYFNKMPTDPIAGAMHLINVMQFPMDLAEG
jgi:hypothetical protein